MKTMKNRLVLLAALIAACTPPASGGRRANLVGTYDLVLVGEPEGDLLAARQLDVTGAYDTVGVPSRYLFVTSADFNQLHILENFRPQSGGRFFLGAPNPLETLSIPVLERPTMLAADEGRNREGVRVTGSYVYAARPGGSEVSVVSIARKRQLGGKPLATPGPVTAIGAWMEVAPAPLRETRMPATTQFFVATWDGEFAAVYSATLKTDSVDIDRLDYERVVLIDQTPISAMEVIPPLSTRTLDGTPFCALKPCLALATRATAGREADAFLIDPQTHQLARLSFPGPVRELVGSGSGTRLYAVLDEAACAECRGVVAVDVVAALTSSGPPAFPAAVDALGLPMRPLRGDDGLITGLTVGALERTPEGDPQGGTIQQIAETANPDGGTASAGSIQQGYRELGAFASSTGLITFFSGLSGSIIDFDGRRAFVEGASVRLPGALPDGGEGFVSEDGGAIDTIVTADVAQELADPSQTWRVSTITSGNAEWRVDISDGYLQSQALVFVYQGQIPGLVSLPTSAADGVRLVTGGFEARAAVGDLVRFESGNEESGFIECGKTTIAAIGSGFVEAAEVPVNCGNRARFSVRASAPKPIVVVGDLEGYMGRWAPGETMSYSRPYVLIAGGVTASRAALTVVIPAAIPTKEGSSTSIQVNGRIVPYQLAIDALGLGCYTALPGQVVLGNMVIDNLPTFSTNNGLVYRWTLMGVVPSGHQVVEIPLSSAHPPYLGPMTRADGTICSR